MSEFAIGGYVLDQNDPEFDEVLQKAHIARERPLCLCTSPGIEMYIAKHGESGYVIKRMPNSGAHHHPDCDSYEIPSELSGRGELSDRAIDEDSSTGLTNIKLDFSLSKVSVDRAMNHGATSENKTVKAESTKLSIRSLLHYLYEEAGLNRWSPAMSGKRNWYIVRKYLLIAVQNKVSRKDLLSNSILIPEQFHVDKKDEIVARHKRFFSRFHKHGTKQNMGIIVGEVKSFKDARFGHKMLIKHMPDTPIYMNNDVYRKICKRFQAELAFFSENETIHLLSIFTFILSASGNPQVETISFMPVDANWLPFENLDELDLLNRACSDNRSFIKGLRYNLLSTDIIASMLMTDTDDSPTAVYVVPAGVSDDYYTKLNTVIESSEVPSKIIDVNEEDTIMEL